jgi:DNA-binding PadR family transcriptional regulator
MEGDILRAVIDPIILNLVSAKAMYGYEIVKEANDRSNGVFTLKEGTLYPCLHRLEAGGLIEGRWEVPESGRKRKYYGITPKGQRVLAQSAEQWKTLSTAVNVLLFA